MHYHCYDNNNHDTNTMINTSWWWSPTPRTCLSFCCPGYLMEIIVGKKKSSWDSEKAENRSTIKTKHKTWEEEQILFFPNNAGFLYGNHSVEKEIKLWLWKYINDQEKIFFMKEEAMITFSKLCWLHLADDRLLDRACWTNGWPTCTFSCLFQWDISPRFK